MLRGAKNVANSSSNALRASSSSLKKSRKRRLASTLSESRSASPYDLSTPEGWMDMQIVRAQRKSLVDHFSQYGSTQTRENAFQPHHPLNRPTASKDLTLSALVAAGAHMGHHRSLMNPNFVPYAYGTRAGITIIDLDQTLPLLRRAAALTRAVAANDGTIIFVGTRADLKAVVRKAAERVGWRHYGEYEFEVEDEALMEMEKDAKEQAVPTREEKEDIRVKKELARELARQGGTKFMSHPIAYDLGEKWMPGLFSNKDSIIGSSDLQVMDIVPDLVIFLNPLANMTAIKECVSERIPTVGIIDSNVDPRIVMYPIPANDESTRTAELIAGVLSIAAREGAALATEERKQMRKRQQRMQQRMEGSNEQTRERNMQEAGIDENEAKAMGMTRADFDDPEDELEEEEEEEDEEDEDEAYEDEDEDEHDEEHDEFVEDEEDERERR